MTTSVLEKLAKQIAKRKIRVVDLTQTLRPSTPVIQLPPPFAQSNPFSISQISHYDDKGPAWYWNNISCGEHTGTHFDAPIHWVTGKDYPDGATDTIHVQRFVAPAVRHRLLEGSRHGREIPAHAEAHRGLGEEARQDPERRLGADAHRLVEAHRPGALPQHEGGRPACAGPERRRRALPRRGARRQRLGRRGGRHRCRPGLRLRAGLPGASPDARREQFGLASLSNLDQLPPTGAVIFAAPLKIEHGSGSPLARAGARLRKASDPRPARRDAVAARSRRSVRARREPCGFPALLSSPVWYRARLSGTAMPSLKGA